MGQKRLSRAKAIFFAIIIAALAQILANYLHSQKDITGGMAKKEEPYEYGIVTKVIDGDTLIVNGTRIRLLGIDSPERGDPCYKEAKKWLEDKVLMKNVSLLKDLKDKDIYGRPLRYLFLNNTNLNIKIVEEGFAIARIEDARKFADEFLKAEESARLGKKGCIWK
jgi:micrococcal nuclease